METRLPQKSLEGKRIRLILCKVHDTPLRPGATGTITSVDEAGQVHVDWDGGFNDVLSWAAGDRWMIIPQNSHAPV